MPAAARKAFGVLNTQIAVYGTQAATAILAARILGPQQRGVMVVAVFVAVLIASAADFGLSDAVAYNIARQHGDQHSISEARAVCVRWVPISGFAILLVYVAIERFAHAIVIRDLGPEVVISSCVLSIAFLVYRVAYGVLVGLQAFATRNLVSVLASAVLLAGILMVIVLHLRATALQLVLIQLFATFVAVTVGLRFVARKHPPLHAPLPQDWRKTYLQYGAKGATTVFVQHMNYRLDTMIVNSLMGGAAVGVYSAGVSAAQVLLLIPAAVSVVQMPRVASAGKTRGVESVPLALGTTLYLVGGCAVVLGIGMRFIVMVLYGKAYQGAIPPGLWLLPGMWAVAVLNVMGSTFSGLGRPGCNTIAVACGLVATAVLDFTLIPRYGIVGAAWASTSAYSLGAIVSIAIFTKVGSMPFRKLLAGSLLEPPKWALARVAMLRSTMPIAKRAEGP